MYSEGVFLALASMIFWGIGDLLTKLSLNRESKWIVLFASQLSGAFILIAIAFFAGGFEYLLPIGILYLIILGILNFFGVATFYKSMHENGISLTSPIVNAWAVVTIFLGITLYGESLSLIQVMGAAIVIGGIVLITFKRGTRASFDQSFLFALASMLFFGIFSFLVKIPVLLFGAITVAISIKLLSAISAVPIPEVRRKIFGIENSLLLLLFALGLFDSFGFLTYNYAISISPVSLVAPIVAASPAISVLLGVFVLREKVSNQQKMGILITLGGLIIISMF